MKSLLNHGKQKAFLRSGLISFTLYIAIIFIFAFLYYKFESITANSGSHIFDNVYFSFVSFHTIGFGDYSPQNDEGKLILWIESIVSLLFHAIFSGYIIWILLKRFPDVIVSDFILLGPNSKGKLSLTIRVGNKGSNIIDAVANLMVYEFRGGNKIRVTVFDQSIEYHTLINQTTVRLRLDLTKSAERINLSTKLLAGITKLIAKGTEEYEDIVQMVFTFKGVDETTGDFVGISKIFTEKHLRFGNGFTTVVGWNGLNPEKRKKPKWNNFNSIEVEMTYELFREQFNITN